MARNTAETVFTGDAANLLATYQQIREESRKNDEQLRQQKQAAKEAHQQEQQALREQIALQKQVGEALKSIQTPLDQLKQKRAEYRALLEQGLITERQYQQLLDKTSAEFKRAKQNTEEYRRALKEQQEAERRRNQEVQEGLRLMREVQTPLERYREKVKQLEQAHQQGTIDAQTYNRQIARARTELDSTSTAAAGAVTPIKNFIGAFAGLAGIHQLLQFIREEIDNIRERQAGAAGTQLAVAEAERAALKNFGAERGGELIAMAQRTQKRTGADYVAILNAMSTGASSLGTGLGDKELEDAVTTAARLSPGNAQEITEGAGAIISQMKVTGGTGAEVAGQQMQAKRLSPVVSDQAFAANIVPGANNLIKMGLTPQQAYGLMAAAGSATDDKIGATTANAMTNLMVQVKTLLPQFDNPYDALEYIRSDEGAKVRRQLLGPLERDLRNAERQAKAGGSVGLTGEKKFLPFQVDLLQPQETAAQRSVDASVRGVPTLAAGGPQLERDIAAINAMPNQLTADMHRRLAAATQHTQLMNVDEGRAHVAREGMREFLKARGMSALGMKFAMAEFEAGTKLGTGGNAVEFLEESFEDRAELLRTPRRPTVVSGPGGAAPPPTRNVQPSAQDLHDAKAFQAIADELGRIREAIEHQTDEMRILESAQPTASPAAAQGRNFIVTDSF